MEPILLIDGTEEGDLSNLKPQLSEYPYTRLRELGLKVYKEVWKQFYEWEPRECQQIINALAGQRIHGEREKYNKAIDQLLDPEVLQDSEMQIDSNNPNQPLLVVTQYDAEGRGISYPLEIEEISVDPTFEAHPPYESCPPINQSMRFSVREAVAFIPYGDEENFPVMQYLDQYESFAWEKDFDPDLEVIQIETVRRLHNTWSMSTNQIDRTRIFPKLLRETYNEGLLWEKCQRDSLRWPAGTEDDIEEACVEPAADDLRARLSSVLATFCPNLNCLRTLCTTHSYPQSELFGGGRPKVTSQSMRLSEGWPCGEECFRLTDESYMDKVHWENKSDRDALETILSISPDLFPCQLAELCFKPCREVFVQRSSIFPDHMVYDDGDAESQTRNNKTRKKQKPRLMFEEEKDHSEFVPIRVPVKKNGANAAVGNDTANRLAGVVYDVNVSIAVASANAVLLIARAIRVTENVCLGSARNAMQGATDDPCANTKLQRNDTKAVEIRRAKYGLGAFAAQDMEPGDFIGDYVGKMLTGNDIELLDCVTKHSGRNYFFEFSRFNFDEMLDAAPVGNATRFLNHATAKLANCVAQVLLVNGEHHIGFYTTKAVACGEELFLWYGDTYWEEDLEPSSN